MAWNKPSAESVSAANATASTGLSMAAIAKWGGGALGGLLIVGAAAWGLWGRGSGGEGDGDPTRSRRIKDLGGNVHTNVPPPKAEEKPLDPNDLDDPRQPWNKDPTMPVQIKGRDGKLYGWVNGEYRSPDSEYWPKKRLLDEKNRRENPFKFSCESDIYVLVDSAPGSFMIPMKFDDAFMKELQTSLVTPIRIEPGDEPEVAERKQVVIDAKNYLKELLRKGEDIRQVLEDHYKDMQRINRMYDNFHEGLSELQVKGASDQEIEDYITSANKVLDKNAEGSLKIPMPRKIRLQQHRRNAAQGGK